MPGPSRLITLNLGSQTVGVAEFRVAHGGLVLVNYRLREVPLDPETSPTVGYRVSAGRARIFYAPDLIFIHERSSALRNVQIYIGDGRNDHTVVHSQTRQSIDRSFARTNATDVVPERRCATGNHHALRI
jgi:hypothetical protein